MKTALNLILTIAVFSTVLISCNNSDCQNSNPVFDNFPPESQEYKAELIKQLKTADPKKLTYWFTEYKNITGNDYLYFRIKGDGICAIVPLLVNNWGKLQDLRQKKGASYRGAEFVNLTFEIQQDSANIEFVFKNFNRIID